MRDGNGNVTGLVDRTGVVNAAYEYDPYGQTLRSVGAYAQMNPFRFSSKYTDDETQMEYFGFRYYDPSNGRFLGRDPTGEQGGINLFAYVNNSPADSWDLLGEMASGGAYIKNPDGSEWVRPGPPGTPWEYHPAPGAGSSDSPTTGTDNGTSTGGSSGSPAGGGSPSSGGAGGNGGDSGGPAGTLGGGDPTGGSLGGPSYSSGADSGADPVVNQDKSGNGVGQAAQQPTSGAKGSSGRGPMGLADYQALAAKLGLNGFSQNLSTSQQLYYGKIIADIVAFQGQGKNESVQWQSVLQEVPGLVTDSNGLVAGDDANIARINFLVSVGALAAAIPSEVGGTLSRIANGGAFPHRNDGAEFQNREGLLPRQPPGYYKEYVVPTAGNPGPGAQRVIIGQNGEVYYTPDHYKTFTRLPSIGEGGGDEKGGGGP